ncbi:hypothetical protein amyaer_4124 [Microcystis aeruginosa NIES-2481]|uniref:PEP-CTERM sorting domain-containing protein n=1 Tax=Microcystis aeruginosa TaxID=1126 RepID=UPI0008201E76|nr:PEP-CTERM sorting domain-containing protein [Microcystis aeruginosa]AOC54811.1 hypothetical protein amyaer_4124 [Microcystis aeruginosa NIES-2481]
MSLKTSLAVATTAIGLTILASPAQAALFSFSYTFNNPFSSPTADTPVTVTGTLTGTATGNIVDVTQVTPLSLSYAGTTLNWTDFDSYSNAFSSSGAPAKVSFDGSVMDIVFGSDTGWSEYFGFGPSAIDPANGLVFNSLFAAAPLDALDTDAEDTPFVPTALTWQLQLVPEPGSVVALLGLGLGALASKVIKKG